jgi:predicted lipid-binding transport protein (Tim44 family)
LILQGYPYAAVVNSQILSLISAAAGGGSGGFGGGGGGGGGGGAYGGGGGGGFSVFGFLVIAVIVVVVLALGAWRTHVYRRQRQDRARRTELAAAEAATDDADFEPATVTAAVTRLFLEIQRRWSANDVAGLEALVGADLMVEWRRRLEDFRRKGWQNRCEPHGEPGVEYLGLVNREGEAEDRVVVRLTATLDDYVVDRSGRVVLKDGEDDRTTTLTEWWTLCPPGDGGDWRLLSIEQDAEGRHHLESELIAVPWADARVSDQALVETAVADAVPAGVAVSEIAPAQLDPDARAAALDLALADGRFAPDVLEAGARRAVQAWVEAVDGADDALAALAEPAAIDALLYGGDGTRRTRVVVRGARVEHLAVVALDPRATPATMTAELTLVGRRYVEDRDTADVVGGSKGSDRETRQRWTFALGDDPATPWRLVAVA